MTAPWNCGAEEEPQEGWSPNQVPAGRPANLLFKLTFNITLLVSDPVIQYSCLTKCGLAGASILARYCARCYTLVLVSPPSHAF